MALEYRALIHQWKTGQGKPKFRDIDFLPCTNQRKQVKQNLGHSCYQAMHNTSKWEVCFTSLSCNHMLVLSSPTPFLFTFPCKTVTLQLSPNCTSTICSYSSSSASFVFFSICTLSSCPSTDHKRALYLRIIYYCELTQSFRSSWNKDLCPHLSSMWLMDIFRTRVWKTAPAK